MDTHCAPRSLVWETAPTASGLHNAERLPQMLKARGVNPGGFDVPDSVLAVTLGLCALLPAVAYYYMPRDKRRGRRR